MKSMVRSFGVERFHENAAFKLDTANGYGGLVVEFFETDSDSVCSKV